MNASVKRTGNVPRAQRYVEQQHKRTGPVAVVAGEEPVRPSLPVQLWNSHTAQHAELSGGRAATCTELRALVAA